VACNGRAKTKSELTEDVEVNVTSLECRVTLDLSLTFVRSVVAELYVVHLQTAAVHNLVLHAVLHSTSDHRVNNTLCVDFTVNCRTPHERRLGARNTRK